MKIKKMNIKCTIFYICLQIIKERRQYHQRSGNRYLRNIENGTSAEVDDTEIIGSM